MTTAERRTFDSRIVVDGQPRMRGYASVFDRDSVDLGGFIERIAQGAFDEVLGDDVRALFNHDSNNILGRTAAGTLRVSVDGDGLRYEIHPPDTQLGRDLAESMRRGDITQSSFAFVVADGGDSWEKRSGLWRRTITKVSQLLDVSPVTYPAYPDARVALRSLDSHRDQSAPRGVSGALRGALARGQLRAAIERQRRQCG